MKFQLSSSTRFWFKVYGGFVFLDSFYCYRLWNATCNFVGNSGFVFKYLNKKNATFQTILVFYMSVPEKFAKNLILAIVCIMNSCTKLITLKKWFLRCFVKSWSWKQNCVIFSSIWPLCGPPLCIFYMADMSGLFNSGWEVPFL